MRFASRIKLVVIFAMVSLGASLGAQSTTNPHTGIRWPSNCWDTGGMVYSPQLNTCITAGGASNPAGTNLQLQFNHLGVFGGANITTDATRNNLNVPGTAATAPLADQALYFTCYGDSLCAGSGVRFGSGWLETLGITDFGTQSNNEGVGGQKVGQICARTGACPTHITVAGGVIPATNPCPVTITWDTGYEASWNVNVVSPSFKNAPIINGFDYNNSNGTTVGGLWGKLPAITDPTTGEPLEGQALDGYWDVPTNTWVFDHTMTFVPRNCPAAPISIPSTSLWTPLTFSFFNGPNFSEGGHNDITSAGSNNSAIEADITSIMNNPANTGTQMTIPIMYSSSWCTGTGKATQAGVINDWWKATWPSSWITQSSQDLLDYLGGLWDPNDPVDVVDHACNPKLVPASLRATYSNKVTLTSNITDTSSCGMTMTGYGESEWILFGTEYIAPLTVTTVGATTTINTCTRGAYGSTAATHTSGITGNVKDAIHLNLAGYTAWGNWLSTAALIQTSLGKVCNGYCLLKQLSNPPPSLAQTGVVNNFVANQVLAPSSADTSANSASANLQFQTRWINADGSTQKGGFYAQASVDTYNPPHQMLMLFAPTVVTPSGASLQYEFSNGDVVLYNNAASTALANQPANPIKQFGSLWAGGVSTTDHWTIGPGSDGTKSWWGAVGTNGGSLPTYWEAPSQALYNFLGTGGTVYRVLRTDDAVSTLNAFPYYDSTGGHVSLTGKAAAGSGAGLTTGPTSATTSSGLACWFSTNGDLKDCGGAKVGILLARGWCTGTATANQTTLYLYGLGASSTANCTAASTSTNNLTLMAQDYTITGVQGFATAGSNAASGAMTVYVNGSAVAGSPLCTFGTSQTCTATGLSIAGVKGDRLTASFSTAAGEASFGNVSFSVQGFYK